MPVPEKGEKFNFKFQILRFNDKLRLVPGRIAEAIFFLFIQSFACRPHKHLFVGKFQLRWLFKESGITSFIDQDISETFG